MSDLIRALQIFLKYGDPRHPTWCSHDELHVCVDPDLVSTRDKRELSRLGFILTNDGFVSHRYGSA